MIHAAHAIGYYYNNSSLSRRTTMIWPILSGRTVARFSTGSMGVDHGGTGGRGNKSTQNLERGTLMQIVPPPRFCHIGTKMSVPQKSSQIYAYDSSTFGCETVCLASWECIYAYMYEVLLYLYYCIIVLLLYHSLYFDCIPFCSIALCHMYTCQAVGQLWESVRFP